MPCLAFSFSNEPNLVKLQNAREGMGRGKATKNGNKKEASEIAGQWRGFSLASKFLQTQ